MIKLVSAVRFGLGFSHNAFKFCTSHVHAFFMHTFFIFIPILSMCCVLFFLSLSLSLSLSLIDYVMAPKQCKSTLARNRLQGSGSSSSIPFHIQIHDKKAKKDFFQNFQARGVHLEC